MKHRVVGGRSGWLSPFGGDTDDPVWTTVDSRQWLLPFAGHNVGQWQAVLRLAFDKCASYGLGSGVSFFSMVWWPFVVRR